MGILNIRDFTFDCQEDGNLYVSGDVEFDHTTFYYDETTGFLFFNDEPKWQSDYFYIDNNGNYTYYEGEI